MHFTQSLIQSFLQHQFSVVTSSFQKQSMIFFFFILYPDFTYFFVFVIQQYAVSLALQRLLYLPQRLALEMQCNAI